MGCAQSRESNDPSGHNHRPRRPQQPSTYHHNWDERNGRYTPRRPQPAHHSRRQLEDSEPAYLQRRRDAVERERNRQALKYYEINSDEKARLKTHYRDQVKRKMAEDYRQQIRENKASLRKVHDKERRGRREHRGKKEMIQVYASPDLGSRWSDWST